MQSALQAAMEDIGPPSPSSEKIAPKMADIAERYGYEIAVVNSAMDEFTDLLNTARAVMLSGAESVCAQLGPQGALHSGRRAWARVGLSLRPHGQ